MSPNLSLLLLDWTLFDISTSINEKFLLSIDKNFGFDYPLLINVSKQNTCMIQCAFVQTFSVGLDPIIAFCVYVSSLFYFYFYFFSLLLRTCLGGQMTTVHEQQPYNVDFSATFISLVGPVNSIRDSQTSLFSNFFH